VRTAQDLPEAERRVLKEVQRRIQQEFPQWRFGMILFGSRARGDADPDSDTDVLVEVDVEAVSFAEKQRVRRVAGEVSIDFGVVLSILISDRRLRAERGDFSIFLNIREEGIPV